MNMERKTIRAVILMVLLAFLSFNASKVAVTEEEVEKQTSSLTAGVTTAIDQMLEKTEIEHNNYRLKVRVISESYFSTEADIVAPEREIVQSADEETEVEETEVEETEVEETEVEETEVEETEVEETEIQTEIQTEIVEQEEVYYSMSEQEFEISCKIAVAEAGNQGLMGMVYVINCAINNANTLGITLLEEYNAQRYSCILNGEVGIVYHNDDGETIFKPITEDMITDEVRQAVSMAISKDYTEELLKDVAIAKGLDSSYYEGGAIFFYNPDAPISERQRAIRENISVSFRHGNHVFYRSWD